LVKGGPDIPAIQDGCSHLARWRGSRPVAGSAPSRAGRVARAVSAHIADSLLQEAPPVVHQPVEQGPGHSAVPERDGRPYLEPQIRVSRRMGRLGDGERPYQTTSRPRACWRGNGPTPRVRRSGADGLTSSITAANAGTSGVRGDFANYNIIDSLYKLYINKYRYNIN
jgi:hypothetical protein